MYIAENLRFLRVTHQLSIRGLAKELNINHSKLIRIEHNSNNDYLLSDIVKLAYYFNITLDEFIMYDLKNSDTYLAKKEEEQENLIHSFSVVKNVFTMLDLESCISITDKEGNTRKLDVLDILTNHITNYINGGKSNEM